MIKYDKPRILCIDFTRNSVEKITNAGYNVRRASTGILKEDNNKFFMPCTISDIEIVLFYVRKNALSDIKKREIHSESVEKEPECLNLLLLEVWKKKGLSILFLDSAVNPFDLEFLSLKNFGITKVGRRFYPAFKFSAALEEIRKITNTDAEPSLVFPEFKGEDLYFSNSVIASVYDKYKQQANHQILSASAEGLSFSGTTLNAHPMRLIYHVVDNSSQENPLCLEITTYDDLASSILIFPTFNNSTDNVVMELLEEYAKEKFDNLFSTSSFSWLKDYKPYPVQTVIDEKNDYFDEVTNKVSIFNENISKMENEFSWLDALLVSKDEVSNEPFKESVKIALEFLGFQVKDIDETLEEGVPKREDLHIIDSEAGFFCICELKTTESGAKESLYRDLHKHMNRYIRETSELETRGILIVNHSIKLEPSKRHGFYKAQHVQDDLRAFNSGAIDSCYLHQLCQDILSNKITSNEARVIFESDFAVLSLQND